jgi:hypothetical protein
VITLFFTTNIRYYSEVVFLLTMYESLQQIIEAKRNQMTNLASVKGISSDETLKISQDLDKLIMLAMKYKTKH